MMKPVAPTGGQATSPGVLHSQQGTPIIAFDEVPFYGTLHGTGRVTLVAQVLTEQRPDGSIPADHVITAHLTGSLHAWTVLRDAIDKMLLSATPAEGGTQ